MMMSMMGLTLLIPLLLIGAVVVFALGWRPKSNLNGPAQTSQTPAEILNARYASGEVSREEFERISRDLAG